MRWQIFCLSKEVLGTSQRKVIRVKMMIFVMIFFLNLFRPVPTACEPIILNVMRLIVSQEKPYLLYDTWPHSLFGAQCGASGGRWYLGASRVLLILLWSFPHHRQCCPLVTSLLTSALSSLPHAHTCTDFHTPIGLLSILNFPFDAFFPICLPL